MYLARSIVNSKCEFVVEGSLALYLMAGEHTYKKFRTKAPNDIDMGVFDMFGARDGDPEMSTAFQVSNGNVILV